MLDFEIYTLELLRRARAEESIAVFLDLLDPFSIF